MLEANRVELSADLMRWPCYSLVKWIIMKIFFFWYLMEGSCFPFQPAKAWWNASSIYLSFLFSENGMCNNAMFWDTHISFEGSSCCLLETQGLPVWNFCFKKLFSFYWFLDKWSYPEHVSDQFKGEDVYKSLNIPLKLFFMAGYILPPSSSSPLPEIKLLLCLMVF